MVYVYEYALSRRVRSADHCTCAFTLQVSPGVEVGRAPCTLQHPAPGGRQASAQLGELHGRTLRADPGLHDHAARIRPGFRNIISKTKGNLRNWGFSHRQGAVRIFDVGVKILMPNGEHQK